MQTKPTHDWRLPIHSAWNFLLGVGSSWINSQFKVISFLPCILIHLLELLQLSLDEKQPVFYLSLKVIPVLCSLLATKHL